MKCVLLLFLAVSLAHPQTVDDVVSKVAEAMGGLDKIRAIKSQRLTGLMSLAPGVDGPLLVELERPAKIHMEVTIDGKTLVRSYDGKTGWQVDPFNGPKGPRKLEGAELQNIAEEADFEGPFIDAAAKGNTLALVGKEPVGGKAAYKVKVARRNGDTQFYYFDAASYLKVKWEGPKFESYFKDYRPVSALKFPFAIDSGAKDGSTKQHMYFESVELDVAIPGSHFAKPK